MSTNEVCVGQIYADVKPPRRQWRVTEYRDGLYVLERLDNPNVVRFRGTAELQDENRYLRTG